MQSFSPLLSWTLQDQQPSGLHDPLTKPSTRLHTVWLYDADTLIHAQAERRMLMDQHLYPPNIAATLAALQRGPDALHVGSSRYGLQVCSACPLH